MFSAPVSAPSCPLPSGGWFHLSLFRRRDGNGRELLRSQLLGIPLHFWQAFWRVPENFLSIVCPQKQTGCSAHIQRQRTELTAWRGFYEKDQWEQFVWYRYRKCLMSWELTVVKRKKGSQNHKPGHRGPRRPFRPSSPSAISGFCLLWKERSRQEPFIHSLSSLLSKNSQDSCQQPLGVERGCFYPL